MVLKSGAVKYPPAVVISGQDAVVLAGLRALVLTVDTAQDRGIELYNTDDQITNFEKGFVKFDTDVLTIGTEVGGSGTARNVQIQTNAVTRMTIDTAGLVTVAGRETITSGTLGDDQRALAITATLFATPSSTEQRGIFVNITSSGSSAQDQSALRINFLAGYTGTGRSVGVRVDNYSLATSTADVDGTGNVGVDGFAGIGVTTGTRTGVHGQARESSTRNTGVLGAAFVTAIGTNIGVAGYGLNASDVQVGGYFCLRNAAPTLTSSALIADNGATTASIFEAWDNGSVVWRIYDGGDLVPEAAFATTMTVGFVYLPGAAGVPTGVPTNAAQGFPLYWDSTGNTLYAYDAGWVAVSGGAFTGDANAIVFTDGAGALASDNTAITFNGSVMTLIAPHADTSGTVNAFAITETWSDGGVNSTTVGRNLVINPTINYTGATRTGKIVGLYINPTNTSLPTGRNAAISLSSTASHELGLGGIRLHSTADEDGTVSWGEVNFDASEVFWIRTRTVGGTQSSMYLDALTIRIQPAVGGEVRIGRTINSGSTGISGIQMGGALTAASGSPKQIDLIGSFSSTAASSTTPVGINIGFSINYTNATRTGAVRLIYLNPTNTSLPTGLSAAISFSTTANALGGIRFHNQTDEVTAYEQVQMAFISNIFVITSTAGVGGTLRGIRIGSVATDLISVYDAAPVAQAAHIPNPSGGAVQDAEARTAINAILVAIENFGITAVA